MCYASMPKFIRALCVQPWKYLEYPPPQESLEGSYENFFLVLKRLFRASTNNIERDEVRR